jgi:hypothetical protein
LKIGPLVFLLALMFLPSLFSALGRWLRQQIAEASAREKLAEVPPVSGQAREHAHRPRRPSLPPPPSPAPPPAVLVRRAVPAPAPTRARLEGLGSPRDLRHSIVVATLLGPCRALDPH